MPKRPTPSELEAVLRAPERARPGLMEVLKALPDDVNAPLAARAALGLIGEGYHPLWAFARTCRRLPVPVIRAVLDQLESDRRPHAFFLRECVPRNAKESDVAAAWDAALRALLDLETTYAWGSKQRRAKLQALAETPLVLQAIQTAAVACEQVSLDMLAVLACDASDASLDALIPHVERAVQKQDWDLDRLQLLRTHARSTPAMDALFARMQALLDARRARSPALGFARELGFGALETFWLKAYVTSPGYRHHAHLGVDSRSATWFTVSVSESTADLLRSPSTRFDSDKVTRDELNLGTCEPGGLPAWLASAAERLGIQWGFDTMSLGTSLRGKKRDQLERWLRGER